MKQICVKCGIEKSEIDFYKSPTCKSGFDTICKCCKKQYAIKWRQTVNGKQVNKKSKVKLKTYDLWYFAKLRAKKKGLEFNIEITDIIIPDVCPILGIPLTKENIKQCDSSPSIDRIDNSKGYVKGNIQIISWRANNIKSNGSVDEHKKVVEFMNNPVAPSQYYDKDIAKERALRLFYESKYRAKEKGLEFNLSKEDILIPLLCPVLNIPIRIDNNKLCEDSPSLDRIDNSKGYIKGNVCVISWRANKLKSYGSIEDHKLLSK
jgi:hypothetical protein